MNQPVTLTVHATTVALGAVAAVLRGPSGAGKSDLALRFLSEQGRFPGIEAERRLVADDQTLLKRLGASLVASAPEGFAGMIEVRGFGIGRVASITSARVEMVFDLVPAAAIERFPLAERTIDWLGCSLPLRQLAPFEASAPLKLALWLAGGPVRIDPSPY